MHTAISAALLLTASFLTVIVVAVNPEKVVVKRSDDAVLSVAVVDQLVAKVQTLEASIAALQNSLADTNKNVARLDTNVAFLAGFQTDEIAGYHPDMIVKYNKVRLNTGNGYDSVTGIFTAPVSGLYAFGIKIEIMSGQIEAMDMVLEGQQVGHIFADDPNSQEMASTFELQHVNKGQRIWVVTRHDSHFVGSMTSHFFGFIVHAD